MMNVELRVFNKSKYEADSKVEFMTTYHGIKSFRVETIDEATMADMGYVEEDDIDEFNEYLTIVNEYGDEAMFRNSHVDLFRI